MALQLASVAVCFSIAVSGLPEPGGPFFWPLGYPKPPTPPGFTHHKGEPPFNQAQCERHAKPFKSKVGDCLWLSPELSEDCVRGRLTTEEYEEYKTLYHYGCIIPGQSDRRDVVSAGHRKGKRSSKKKYKEDALPATAGADKSRKGKLPAFTSEQCERLQNSFKSRTIDCGLRPKEERFDCVADNLNPREWRTFLEVVERGCKFDWMKGDTRGQMEQIHRRDRGQPDTHRPPWMSDWNGNHWNGWEKVINVKLPDFLIHGLDRITPDIPANWLLHYPFGGGKGRQGKISDEHEGVRHDLASGGKPNFWHPPKRKRSRSGLIKRQLLLPADEDNPALTRASQHNNFFSKPPVWQTEANVVPTFEGRPCVIVNEFDEEVTYEESRKDENGYVRVKCSGPEMSSPDVHFQKPDTMRPWTAKFGWFRKRDGGDHISSHVPEGFDKVMNTMLDGANHAFDMGKTPRYGEIDWAKVHNMHWSNDPVYFKNHEMGRDCYSMHYHFEMMTCYFMWKPGTG